MPVIPRRPTTARAAVASLLVALGAAAPAGATFPGINGELAYTGTDGGLRRAPLGGLPGPGARTVVSTPIGAASDTARDVRWSPDGGSIVFSSAVSGDREVYALDVRRPGTLPVRLTHSPGPDTDPSFSADGRSIAFTSARGGSEDIWVMGADGSGPRQLTTSPASERHPAYSPRRDGRIAFQSDRDGDSELFTIADDGTGETQLTHNDRFDADASWSPDGRLLAYTTGRDARDAGVAVMAAAADAPPRTITDPAHGAGSPAWSPDGRWIAYERSSAVPRVRVRRYPPTGWSRFVTAGDDADWGVLPAVDEATRPAPGTATVGGSRSGRVLVRPPGATTAQPLAAAARLAPGAQARRIPFGTRIDAQPGSRPLAVDLDVAIVRRAPALRTTVTGGVYTVERRGGALRLELADLEGCPRRGKAAPAVLARNDVTVKRRGGRGAVSTHSRRRHVTTYTRDTEYRVVERCRRTTIEVLDGKLTVRQDVPPRVTGPRANPPAAGDPPSPRTLEKGQRIVLRS